MPRDRAGQRGTGRSGGRAFLAGRHPVGAVGAGKLGAAGHAVAVVGR
ncbi:hypothetical protein GA0115240_14601, partial [Streptomyces sp. DvalAA-14]